MSKFREPPVGASGVAVDPPSARRVARPPLPSGAELARRFRVLGNGADPRAHVTEVGRAFVAFHASISNDALYGPVSRESVDRARSEL